MDLVSQAGIDTADWASGGRNGPASNPKYCYEWCFQNQQVVVLSLWFEEIRTGPDDRIYYETNARHTADNATNGPARRRARELDEAIQLAHSGKRALRVIVCTGVRRKPGESTKASRVKHRMLDPETWRVEDYNQSTGSAVLVRGRGSTAEGDYTEDVPDASNSPHEVPRGTTLDRARNAWTTTQLKLAFHLYCQLPFGRLHQRAPEIIELAELVGRTPSAVAMKLSNFASLDPAITSTGRRGLEGASTLDREIWDEFHADWEGLAIECAQLREQLEGGAEAEDVHDEDDVDYSGETRRTYQQQRIKQTFFRRTVLTSYRGRCCMSGVSEDRLLIASHIVPWSKDTRNRLNPRNGLCLSAIHDRAFDQGLLALSEDLRVLVSRPLRTSQDNFIREVLAPLHGRPIEVPEKFFPNPEFLKWHREGPFVGE